MAAKPIPDGFHCVTPYLSIKGAKEAIEFYRQAFGAVEVFRLSTPTGDIGHAEMLVGDSHIMMSEPCEESPIPSPAALGGSTVAIHLYVNDVDTVFARAVDAGATVLKAVEDQFYGDRMGTIRDPFGHVWFLGTHKEDLTPEQIQKRAAAMFGSDNA